MFLYIIPIKHFNRCKTLRKLNQLDHDFFPHLYSTTLLLLLSGAEKSVKRKGEKYHFWIFSCLFCPPTLGLVDANGCGHVSSFVPSPALALCIPLMENLRPLFLFLNCSIVCRQWCFLCSFVLICKTHYFSSSS